MLKTLGKISTKQNLSSESLFHITSSIDILKSILDNGFQARYIYEKIPGCRLAYFTRTVCFCDIPLGAIKYHLNWYGNYSIGINRSWAKTHKITPVIYIHSNSPLIKPSTSQKNIEELKKNPITQHLKQVKGKQIFFDEKTKKHYWKWKKFYEEREWRYFPDRNNIDVVRYGKEQELETVRQQLNHNNLPHLSIDLASIEYLIVKDISEVSTLISEIRKLTINEREQDMLITKIVTVSQIQRDF